MTITYQDLTMYYEVYGNKDKTILILPGWGETRNTFMDMIHILQLEYTVYIVDYPGFGNSPFPDRELTMMDYAQLIAYFIQTLQLKELYIIAHSFGGRIAILLSSQLAIYLPKLVLIDSAGIKPKRTLKSRLKTKIYKTLQKLSNLLPSKWRKKAKNWLFQKFASSDYYQLPAEQRSTFRNIINLDLTPYLPYVQAETLLLWGAKDIDTPLKDGIKMQRKIANSELIIFPRSTHFCYLENPYVIVKTILSFFTD